MSFPHTPAHTQIAKEVAQDSLGWVRLGVSNWQKIFKGTARWQIGIDGRIDQSALLDSILVLQATSTTLEYT